MIEKDKVIRHKTKLEDAEDGVINIKMEKKGLEGAIIKYDHILMDCVNYENNSAIDPSSKVFQGMKLKFTAKLKAGFELINWAINGIAKTDERREVFIYTVNIADAKAPKTLVSVELPQTPNELSGTSSSKPAPTQDHGHGESHEGDHGH